MGPAAALAQWIDGSRVGQIDLWSSWSGCCPVMPRSAALLSTGCTPSGDEAAEGSQPQPQSLRSGRVTPPHAPRRGDAGAAEAPASAPLPPPAAEAELGSADTPVDPAAADALPRAASEPAPACCDGDDAGDGEREGAGAGAGAGAGVDTITLDTISAPPTPAAAPPLRTYQVRDQLFAAPAAYMPEDVVGGGAYGTVCRAAVAAPRPPGLPPLVAVKKMRAPRRAGELLRAVREVALLSRLQHANVISLCDAWAVSGDEPAGGLYLVTPLLSGDLGRILAHYKTGLLLQQVQCLAAQLFAGLAYVHREGVIHRDLKPQNLVVNADCELRIVDFGLARDGDSEGYMTTYVVTRWYRPPELLMQSRRYDAAVDMWSAGCIVAEMLTGTPRWRGRDCKDQLRLIVEGVGGCAAAAAAAGASAHALSFLEGCLTFAPPAGAPAVPCKAGEWTASEAAVADYVGAGLLRFDPEERDTAARAAAHSCWGEYARRAADLPAGSPHRPLHRELQELDRLAGDSTALRARLAEELRLAAAARGDGGGACARR